MTCAKCGKTYHHTQWRGQDTGKGQHYCSRSCYLSSPFPQHPHIRQGDIDRVQRLYPTQVAQSAALGVSYPQYRRVIRRTL